MSTSRSPRAPKWKCCIKGSPLDPVQKTAEVYTCPQHIGYPRNLRVHKHRYEKNLAVDLEKEYGSSSQVGKISFLNHLDDRTRGSGEENKPSFMTALEEVKKLSPEIKSVLSDNHHSATHK